MTLHTAPFRVVLLTKCHTRCTAILAPVEEFPDLVSLRQRAFVSDARSSIRWLIHPLSMYRAAVEQQLVIWKRPGRTKMPGSARVVGGLKGSIPVGWQRRQRRQPLKQALPSSLPSRPTFPPWADVRQVVMTVASPPKKEPQLDASSCSTHTTTASRLISACYLLTRWLAG